MTILRVGMYIFKILQNQHRNRRSSLRIQLMTGFTTRDTADRAINNTVLVIPDRFVHTL